MEDIEIKTCPFCGKYVMCSPDEPPEDVCDCPEAQHKRESAMRFEKLKTAIETSCGKVVKNFILCISRSKRTN